MPHSSYSFHKCIYTICAAGKPQRHRALATRTPAVIERIGSGSTSGNNNRTIKIATVPLRRGGNAFSSLESIITSTFNSAQPGARCACSPSHRASLPHVRHAVHLQCMAQPYAWRQLLKACMSQYGRSRN